MLIDNLTSAIDYFYKQPSTSIFNNDKEDKLEIEKTRIPFVEQADIKQRLYIIPQQFSEIWASLAGQYRNESYKIDIETPSTHAEFKLQNSSMNFNYCHATNMYLASPDEYIYTKITTVNPYYIFVN